jgi:hypothetical protein
VANSRFKSCLEWLFVAAAMPVLEIDLQGVRVSLQDETGDIASGVSVPANKPPGHTSTLQQENHNQ